jgi:hypothetical protein
MNLRTLSMAAAIAGLVFAPSMALAAKNHHSGARSHGHAAVHAHASARHAAARRSTRSRVTTHRATRRAVHRNVRRHVAHSRVRIGHRYHGGVWYGARRHYWRGRWYAYGVGSCWLPTPIGYVWVCGA